MGAKHSPGRKIGPVVRCTKESDANSALSDFPTMGLLRCYLINAKQILLDVYPVEEYQKIYSLDLETAHSLRLRSREPDL